MGLYLEVTSPDLDRPGQFVYKRDDIKLSLSVFHALNCFPCTIRANYDLLLKLLTCNAQNKLYWAFHRVVFMQ